MFPCTKEGYSGVFPFPGLMLMLSYLMLNVAYHYSQNYASITHQGLSSMLTSWLDYCQFSHLLPKLWTVAEPLLTPLQLKAQQTMNGAA